MRTTQQGNLMTLRRTVLLGIVVLYSTALTCAAAFQGNAARLIGENVERNIPLQPTDRLPGGHGEVQVMSNGDTIEVEVRMDHVKPASLFGGDYSTYIVWAISPGGRMQNLGEMQLD